ncbi:MAG: zinc-dependent alcohol dehydrogenase [Limnochordia bacterium]
MRAALLKEVYEIEITDVPEVYPKAGEVKIQVKLTGICGSEIHAFKGTHPYRKPPVILGHELAGDVVEVGAGVTEFKVGDRVIVEPQIACGKCPLCAQNLTNLCDNKIVLGTSQWSGSFAEYIVAPTSVVYKLPESLSYAQGVMVEPLAVGVHAVRVSDMRLGDNVLVLGAGTIGLVTLLAAKAAGAKNIYVTDVAEYNLKVAEELGAVKGINVAKENPLEAIGSDKIDVVFVTAGLGPVVQQALQTVRKRGQVVIIALFDGPIQLEMFPITGKEIDIRGCMMYTGDDFQKTIDLMTSGQINVDPLISEILDIEETQQGLEIVDQKTKDAIKVLLKF